MDSISYITAFTIGILGSVHCLGMCSGIISVLTLSIANKSKLNICLYLFLYNIGRITSYVIIGITVGTISSIVTNITGYIGFYIFKILSGLSLIILGLYLSGWWKVLLYAEKYGYKIWKNINYIIKKIIPIKNSLYGLILGMLWGFLPCGLVYSCALWCANSGSLQKNLILMFLFGLGTLPSMIITSTTIHKISVIIKAKILVKILGLCIIFLGTLHILAMFFIVDRATCH
ncbi:MAG TPA: sulfite exporter TauE/SafE family protein [Candidatus Azoamicus sp. OHIO1]